MNLTVQQIWGNLEDETLQAQVLEMVGGEWSASNVYSIEELQHTKELCEIGNAASSPNASRLSTLLASEKAEADLRLCCAEASARKRSRGSST